MRFVCYCLLIFWGIAQVLASTPARIPSVCKSWSCINEILGAQDNGNLLLNRASLNIFLGSVLPNQWEKGIENALNICFNDTKPRQYSSVCPGQNTWHCIVDQLIENCPVSHQHEDDACTPIASIVGANYLFSQSAYVNMDSSSQNDQRPQIFLRNIYRSKCCDLPSLFSSSTLGRCGVSNFLNRRIQQSVAGTRAPPAPRPSLEAYCSQPMQNINPLECCDVSDIVPPNVFAECGVDVQWQKDKRLVFEETTSSTARPVTTEIPPARIQHRNPDVKVVPVSCPDLTCVFQNLSILSGGSVDRDAFTRLLNNIAREHPQWRSARARALTRCLRRDLSLEYEGCEIYRLVACTLDVLSESCPNVKKGRSDPCRHSSTSHNTTVVCQVSSSKYKKSRHRYCDVPRLVPASALHACGLTALSRMVTVNKESPAQQPPKKYVSAYKPLCINTSNGTACVMDKMGLLNKYRFMDYNKMKVLVESVVRDRYSWSVRKSLLEDSLRSVPLYREHCHSTRKLMNVMDAAISNCPLEKRKYTNKCASFYGHLYKCTNATLRTAPKPSAGRPSSAHVNINTQAKPLFLNVTFLNTNRTVAGSKLYQPVVLHTVAKYPKYAPKYPYYIPTSQHSPLRSPFPGSRYPPTPTNSNLGIFIPGVRPASPGQPLSTVYSPIFSHGYVASRLPGRLEATPAPNARVVPFRPYFKDHFRSAANPFFIHNAIASANKNQDFKTTEKSSTNTPAVAPQTPTPLQHLMPVEDQVYE